jgi:hypothetical protein
VVDIPGRIVVGVDDDFRVRESRRQLPTHLEGNTRSRMLVAMD